MPDDPNYPWQDWQYEVANGDTRLGYDEWVQHKRDACLTRKRNADHVDGYDRDDLGESPDY